MEVTMARLDCGMMSVRVQDEFPIKESFKSNDLISPKYEQTVRALLRLGWGLYTLIYKTVQIKHKINQKYRVMRDNPGTLSDSTMRV